MIDLNARDAPERAPALWLGLTSGILVGIMIVTAVVGNVLVLLSYRRDRSLRSVHHIYIVNLAICDLTNGLVSMPCYLILKLNGGWPFGPWPCKMYLAAAYTVCAMSVLVVIFISWNRLAMLRHWAAYKIVETRKRAYVRLGVGWSVIFFLNALVILLWDVVKGSSSLHPDDCTTEFKRNKVFSVTHLVLQTVVPILFLGVLQWFISVAVRKRFLLLQADGTSQANDQVVNSAQVATTVKTDLSSATSMMSDVSFDETKESNSALMPPIQSHSVDKLKSAENSAGAHLAMTDLPALSPAEKETADVEAPDTTSQPTHSSPAKSKIETSPHPRAPEPVLNAATKTVQSSSDSKDGTRRDPLAIQAERMAKMEMGVVLVLALTWGPFIMSNALQAGCPTCLHPDVYSLTVWLVWIKSSFDPMIYAYSCRRFRLNFKQLLGRI